MSEPIIRTMWLSDDDLVDLVGGHFIVELSHKAGNREAPHPVLVTHAPEMPGFKKGDRVRFRGFDDGTVTAPPAWDGEDWWVPVRWDSEAVVRWERAPGLTLVEPTKPEPPKPAPAQEGSHYVHASDANSADTYPREPEPVESGERRKLARLLEDFRDGDAKPENVVAALDDYISRALERER